MHEWRSIVWCEQATFEIVEHAFVANLNLSFVSTFVTIQYTISVDLEVFVKNRFGYDEFL